MNTILKAPVVCFPLVFHVGTMNPDNKRRFSYEGKGLSVSRNPEDWQYIAKLGGFPIHTLTKPDSKFLDFHQTDKQSLFQWALKNQFITTEEVWSISHYDDELETMLTYYTEDPSEAQEAKGEGEQVKKLEKFAVPTKEAIELSGIHPTNRLTSNKDILALVLAEQLGFDGVWWNDILDPDRYSAPRGVIFPNMLPTWNVY